MYYNKIGWILLFLLCSTLASAAHQSPYHLKLLAVQDDGNGYIGSDADLYLEIKEGSGRVFLDTLPLTKFDTQISTRFAKDVACKHFQIDCNTYDFIYTIRSDTSIIGGPSAGAAIAALTTIAMLDLEYNQDATLTGTINSGGTIGPVGGVKEKLQAASAIGLKKVLVAKGSSKIPAPNGASEDINLTSYGRENLSMEVVEVLTLDEVVKELTGKDLNGKVKVVQNNTAYAEIMKGLRDVLCQRTDQIERTLGEKSISLDENAKKELQQRQQSAAVSAQQGDYYSSASFCFSANIDLRTEYYKYLKISAGEVERLFLILERKSIALKQKLNQEPIATISDLQTFMIVSERLADVQDQIRSYRREPPNLNETYAKLAYAEERFFSALSWMQFFSMEGTKFTVDEEHLRTSCQQKVSEGEERAQYAALFLGEPRVRHLWEKMARAQDALNSSEYALCLITASQAKADANAILSTVGHTNETLPDFVDAKKKAVELVIAENSAEGIFPILGYSYYQYANSLQQEEPVTALVYLEYALEMSDLSIYFPEEKSSKWKISTLLLKKEHILILEGFLGGIVTSLLFFLLTRLFRKKRRR